MRYRCAFVSLWVLLPYASVALAQSQPDDKIIVSGPTEIIPDIRDDEASFKLLKGDFVVVPIPTANPTLDAGLARILHERGIVVDFAVMQAGRGAVIGDRSGCCTAHWVGQTLPR